MAEAETRCKPRCPVVTVADPGRLLAVRTLLWKNHVQTADPSTSVVEPVTVPGWTPPEYRRLAGVVVDSLAGTTPPVEIRCLDVDFPAGTTPPVEFRCLDPLSVKSLTEAQLTPVESHWSMASAESSEAQLTPVEPRQPTALIASSLTGV